MNELDLGTVAVCVIAGAYAVSMLYLLAAFRRPQRSSGNAHELVSVIVCARNEQDNIPSLIPAMKAQTYSNIEFIIVNDRSTDRTGELLAQAARDDSRFHVVEIKERSSSLPSKKNAITEAIRSAKGEIVCLTDADCVPPPTWVVSMAVNFGEEVGLVAGFSPYHMEERRASQYSPGIRALLGFVRFEEVLTSFLGASCARAGFAWLCSGRNLAYRKRVFEEVGGFDSTKHSISGDDDLFLQTVRERTSWKIVYTTAAETFVPTTPPMRWKDFFNQRLRHFSDGKYYPFSVQLVLFLYHTGNLIILAYFVLGAAGYANWVAGACSLLLKFSVDALIVRQASRQFDENISRMSIIPNSIAYIFYNTLIGPLGFLEQFSWKQ